MRSKLDDHRGSIAILDDRHGCIRAPPTRGIGYAGDAMVLNSVVIRGARGARGTSGTRSRVVGDGWIGSSSGLVAPGCARCVATARRRGGHPISIARNGARRGRIRALRMTTNAARALASARMTTHSARRLGVVAHDHQFGASLGGRRRARPPIRRVVGRRRARPPIRRVGGRRDASSGMTTNSARGWASAEMRCRW